MGDLILGEALERRIHVIRGHKVMLDRDLADLYKIRPIALRQQVKRNQERFPADFMFQLSEKETEFLVSQHVIPSRQSLGGFLPYAFTEQGVAMLSSVLRSKRAVLVNIAIMRAFVRMRKILASHNDLAVLGKHVKGIKDVLEAIYQMMPQPEPPGEEPRQVIGFGPR